MEEQEYNFIKRQILRLTGVDLNFYKTPQMQRRLKTYLLRSGQKNWQDYFKLAGTDAKEQRKLKDYLTINVSSFFRDPDKYVYLKEKVLPELLRGKSPVRTGVAHSHRQTEPSQSLRIWSAGCSLGQEPYTIAMLLAGLTGPYTRHYILATDLDRTALDKAEAGGPYTADDVSNVAPDLLQRYFKQQSGSYYVNQALKSKITFRQHNLLADRFENNFDLIICRNVVIYFTAEVKDQLYRNFTNSLRSGGMLFVGGTEIVSNASTLGLKTAGISFYRRNGAIYPPGVRP